MSERAIIRIEKLEKVYRMGDVEVRALRGVDLAIYPGEYVAIMGASGSGKSTLLNVLGCLDRPSGGKYFLGGEDVATMDDDALSAFRGRTLGFVFQSYNLIQQLTVIENIHVPLFYQGRDLSECEEHCVRLAKMVGLGERLDHRPKQLSGGQQQRVAIARALVHGPRLVVCDEPTSALDHETGQKVMALMREVAMAHDRSLVIVTHDARIFGFADRIARMDDGHIDSISAAGGNPSRN